MRTFNLLVAPLIVVVAGYYQLASAQPYPAANEVGDCSTGQYANCDSSPDQAQLELAGSSGAQNGNWDDLSGGVANRPFVQRLSVLNGGIETVLLQNGTTTSTLSNTPGSVGVIISPTNLCDSTEDPSNPTNNCYSSPNRIQVTLVYRKSIGQVGYNLSYPNDGDMGTLGGSALQLKSFDGSTNVTINENTTIDLTLALNTLGQSLRWTWANGVPLFWAMNDLGTPTATVRIKFRPASQPAIKYDLIAGSSFCTAIPVQECNVDRSHSDWLGASMILSLDETLSEGMTGALFGTEGAIIGSVDLSVDVASGLPGLTYGVASSHLTSLNAERSATLRAFIPAAGLVQVLGIPSFSGTIGRSTRPGAVISAERTDQTATSTNAFEVWNEASNGSDGLLVTISGITFSAPQYQVQSKAGTPRPPSIRATKKNYLLNFRGSASGVLKSCRTKQCTVTVYRAPADPFKSRLSDLARKTASVSKGKFRASFSIKKSSSVKVGTRLLLVITNKQKRVLSSTPVTLQ